MTKLGITCSGLALALLALAGCHSAGPLHVVVDPTLATGDVYEVSGLTNRYWGKPMRFGDFQTRKTRVGESWSWSAGLWNVAGGNLGGGVRVQPYRFVFVGEQGAEWQVECRAKTPILRHAGDHHETEVRIGDTRLGCAIRDANERVNALSLTGYGYDFTGTTDFGGEPIDIRVLRELPGRDGRPVRIPGVLGYELRQGSQVMASVDLLGKGRVYLAREAPAELRDQLAMTATVLMFFGES